jgi:hypothetical protein
MKRVFVVVVLGLLLVNCGGGNGPGGQARVTLTGGNWAFRSTAISETSQLVFFSASLTQTGTSLTGLAYIGLIDCYDLLTALPISGTVSGNSVTLKAGTTDVVTIAGTIAGSKLVTGTYSVTGPCAGGDHGPITGTYVPPLTGTWKATQVVNGTSVTMTFHLTQQETASALGYFPLTGTVEYAGSPCVLSGTTDSNISFVLGDLVAVMVNTSESGGGSGQVLYGGALDDPATASSFRGFESVVAGTCTSSGQLITFTKQ